MYRGITTFSCTACGLQFKSHDNEYRATAFSVPQHCPNCGSVRTMPGFWIEPDFCETGISIYESIWEEIERAEKEREERIRRIEAKRKAVEERQRKKQAKKRNRMSRKQREAYDIKRAKKTAKRSKTTTDNKPMHQEEIILLGPTWFPAGTPLKIDDE